MRMDRLEGACTTLALYRKSSGIGDHADGVGTYSDVLPALAEAVAAKLNAAPTR